MWSFSIVYLKYGRTELHKPSDVGQEKMAPIHIAFVWKTKLDIKKNLDKNKD